MADLSDKAYPKSLDIVWDQYAKRQQAQEEYESKSLLIHPTAQFVVKTRFPATATVNTYSGPIQTPAGCKVFVNICSHDAIAPPRQTQAPGSESEEVSVSAPSACSEPRFEKDHEGTDCIALDVVFHPSAVALAQGRFDDADVPQDVALIAREMCLRSRSLAAFRDFLVEVALAMVERRANAALDYDKLSFPRLKFKGTGAPPPQRIRRPGVSAEDAAATSSGQVRSSSGGALIEEVVDEDENDNNITTKSAKSTLSSSSSASLSASAKTDASSLSSASTPPSTASGATVLPVKVFCRAPAGDAEAPRAADGGDALELYADYAARCVARAPGLPAPPAFVVIEVRETQGIAPADVRVAVSGGDVVIAFAQPPPTSAFNNSKNGDGDPDADSLVPFALSRRFAPVSVSLPFAFRAGEVTARVVLSARKVVVALPVAGYAPVFAELQRARGLTAGVDPTAPAPALSLTQKRVARALATRVEAQDAALFREQEEAARWREREHEVLRTGKLDAAVPVDYWERPENKPRGQTAAGAETWTAGFRFENPFVDMLFG
mgnify:CR=1 FL=1